MPFVRIDLVEGRSAEFRHTMGEIVYQAMRETIDVPPDDKFQVISEHKPGGLNHAPSYRGNTYSPGIVFIQVTLSAGRTLEKKRAFYRAVAEGLHARLGVRREDVVINLVEVATDNWSFGNGIAQYAT